MGTIGDYGGPLGVRACWGLVRVPRLLWVGSLRTFENKGPRRPNDHIQRALQSGSKAQHTHTYIYIYIYHIPYPLYLVPNMCICMYIYISTEYTYIYIYTEYIYIYIHVSTEYIYIYIHIYIYITSMGSQPLRQQLPSKALAVKKAQKELGAAPQPGWTKGSVFILRKFQVPFKAVL